VTLAQSRVQKLTLTLVFAFEITHRLDHTFELSVRSSSPYFTHPQPESEDPMRSFRRTVEMLAAVAVLAAGTVYGVNEAFGPQPVAWLFCLQRSFPSQRHHSQLTATPLPAYKNDRRRMQRPPDLAGGMC
jgi:hypothetical protein